MWVQTNSCAKIHYIMLGVVGNYLFKRLNMGGRGGIKGIGIMTKKLGGSTWKLELPFFFLVSCFLCP